MPTYEEKIISKFKLFSDKHHKLSLLFYELAQSLKHEAKKKNPKEFKIYLKETLNLDLAKLERLSKGITEISLKSIQKEVTE